MKRWGLWGVIAAVVVAVGGLAAGGRGILYQAIYNSLRTGSADITQQEWNKQFVTVKEFGAKGDGVTDDTVAVQAALSTGKNVYCPTGSPSYKLTNSLYMNTSGQAFTGDCLLTMSAALGKPMLWLGASDANGTDDGTGALNMKVIGLRFLGTGSKVSGSSGITFLRATTTTVSSVYSWASYAGIDVRGIALANVIENSDLRQNNYGIWDKTDASTTINFQASSIRSNRIEQNIQEGIVAGSSDLRIVENTIEGNSAQSLGGTGTDPEIRFTPGFANGSIDLADNYFEVLGGNTPTGIIQVDATVNKKITLKGGNYYGNDATNRCIINDLSAGTVQGYAILGGNFTTFKNYICGAITNNSTVIIMPAWADASRDVTSTLTATAGAVIVQNDRLLGLKVTGASFTGTSLTASAAAAATAIQLTTGAFINFGGSATIKGDVSNQLITNGNLFLNSSGTSTLHAATVQRDDTANGLFLKGNMASTSGIGVLLSNATSLTASGDRIACFAPDNGTTKVGCVDIKGGWVTTGVTFANLATGSTTNGTITYCSDCTIANPCASGGSGAFAKRLNAVWVCN